MSQSNNKTKTAKKTLLFLLIFAIICAGITSALIYNTLQIRKESLANKELYKDEYEEKETLSKKKLKNVNPVVLTDKYLTNGLSVKKINEVYGDVVEAYPNGENLMQCEISYPQISGLKNVNIEEKMNKEIKEKVLSLKDDNLYDIQNFEYYRIDADIYGNFSDVLSVEIYFSLCKRISSKYDYDFDYTNKIYGLNYRLDTGEQLSFEDLFMPNTSLKSVVRNFTYEHLAWQYAYEQEDMGANFDNIDYGKIEEETFKYVSKYIQNSNIEFCFSPTTIIACIDDAQIYIGMEKITDWIAIYTAYKSNNSLYKDNSIQRQIYPYTEPVLTEAVVESKLKLNNFYYEIIAYPRYTEDGILIKDEYEAEVAQKVIGIVNEKIKYYEEIAKQNPDKGYMSSVNYYYNDSEEFDDKSYSYNGYVTEMDKDYFTEHYEEFIAKGRRKITGDISAIDYSWLIDEDQKDKVVFYESFSKYTSIGAEDENDPEYIVTKEERQKEIEEWERLEAENT